MIFIKFEDITDEVTIDCRTVEEFERMPLLKYNIPMINKETHKRIKKFYPCAYFVIAYYVYKNREEIKRDLNLYTENGKLPVVFGCSRGRFRSPIMYIYARLHGFKRKILFRGIKRFFE